MVTTPGQQLLHARGDARGVGDRDRRGRDAEVVGPQRRDPPRHLLDRRALRLGVDEVDAIAALARDRREHQHAHAGDGLLALAQPVPAAVPEDVGRLAEHDGRPADAMAQRLAQSRPAYQTNGTSRFTDRQYSSYASPSCARRRRSS